MTHQELVQLGVRWLDNRGFTVFYEFATAANETPDAIGWKAGRSTLIETKASRQDFLSDKKKLARRMPELGLGRQRYYLCPHGIITPEDLPERWGLLWTKSGRIYVKRKALDFPEMNQQGEIVFLASMLRRVQVRLGNQLLTEWLRWENRKPSGGRQC